MNWCDMCALVFQCQYKPNWTLHIVLEGDEITGRPYIQWQVTGLDSTTRELTVWSTGKRYLSWHMCRQEVVASVFSLALAAEEHEAREWFRYKGSSIYNPHLDPDVLAEIARWKENFNVRDNAMNPR